MFGESIMTINFMLGQVVHPIGGISVAITGDNMMTVYIGATTAQPWALTLTGEQASRFIALLDAGVKVLAIGHEIRGR